MHTRLLVPAIGILLAAAGCTVPGASPTTPNGDVTQRQDRSAPDTVAGAKPARGFRDKAVDTDPSTPRTRDSQQKVQVPFVTQ